MTRIDTSFLLRTITRLQRDRRITPAFAGRLTRQVTRLTNDTGTADHAELLRALHVIATDEAYPGMAWSEFWAVAGEAIANGLINGDLWTYAKQ